MQIIHIVLEVQEGVVQDPETFRSEESARRHYESIVTSDEVKFRKKNDNETWDDYVEAFQEYEESDQLPYDKMDFEIHWWESELLP